MYERVFMRRGTGKGGGACESGGALRWFPRQVGDEGGDGADVGDDAEDDGEDGEPQGLAGRRAGPLEVPLRRRLVGLDTSDRRRAGKTERVKVSVSIS